MKIIDWLINLGLKLLIKIVEGVYSEIRPPFNSCFGLDDKPRSEEEFNKWRENEMMDLRNYSLLSKEPYEPIRLPSYSAYLKTFEALLAGIAVATTALAGRYGIQAWQAFKARPPRMRKFYEGGFQATMTRREAALVLGVRESATPDKVKEAHRKVMVANHPDAGGSHYLASKINEAKDMMLGKIKGGGSVF
ncbi:Mitochondrial import inner membrane translocase subunit tim14 [Thalictrum thalictroides]|uniref:Mitochondrial import inner membrane translocase subunit tim14 n=1 Tax=Thalictrum thalictroides TaxID=46969 RepID=A0A7J6WRK8_THATH|nr:Mitochondrial import inner membrane translocase subunit tim14 [Thalictrum thalictroides]